MLFSLKSSSPLGKDEGLVLVAAALNVFIVNMWMSWMVVAARKKYNVKYPALYAATNATPFNCVQRAHQNSLETFPAVMLLLVLGAAVNPRRAALAAIGWGVSRVVYFIGYARGNPEGRLPGVALSYVALLTLMHLVAASGSHLLRGHSL